MAMSMRVQSGSARGRSIKALPTGPEVRPILARIRKSLFDILRPRLAGARFLDLFAGTGTVGIEALSNGAASAVFIDASPTSCRMIAKNLDVLGFTPRARVVRADVVHEMRVLAGDQFELVFMGPPYKDEEKRPLALTVPALRALDHTGVLALNGLVIGQHHKKEPMTDLPNGWELFRQNIYGDSILSFFRRKERATEGS
jgi:16S rRNA (guanine(966)-N(2))-methyltransferase RsmD